MLLYIMIECMLYMIQYTTSQHNLFYNTAILINQTRARGNNSRYHTVLREDGKRYEGITLST